MICEVSMCSREASIRAGGYSKVRWRCWLHGSYRYLVGSGPRQPYPAEPDGTPLHYGHHYFDETGTRI